jgi:tetraprenyl-beta-curcumene synthase
MTAMGRGAIDPTPLGLRQLSAFVAVAVRELAWVIPNVAREVRRWQVVALDVPHPALRDDATLTLRRERLNTEGAALFAILPRRRNLELLRVLGAYQMTLDYLDTISERPCEDPLGNGRQLHRALTEAVAPGGPISDYYRLHPQRDDGGYLRALVQTCRAGCEALPSFELVRARVARAAHLGTVQVPNHDPSPARRIAGLRAWVERELPGPQELRWFELTAAASSSLWTLALLALAADPQLRADDVAEAEAVYFPWICAASTLLDAFVDQPSDRAEGNHSYVEHYDSDAEMVERLCEIVYRSVDGARRLRNGERHALIAAGMVSMYLSKASARIPELREASARIGRATGSLLRLQLPIMRAMRAAQRLGDA